MLAGVRVWDPPTFLCFRALEGKGRAAESPEAPASRAGGLAVPASRRSLGGSLVWLIVRGYCSWGRAERQTPLRGPYIQVTTWRSEVKGAWRKGLTSLEADYRSWENSSRQ